MGQGLPPGTILGNYRILGPLGEGGFAQVYHAQHAVLGRDVAIKVLNATIAEEESFRERFRREAIAAAKIVHPNVVTVFDFGEAPGGVAYIVMEWVRGATLQQVLARGRPFSAERAARVMREIALGLTAAHGLGLIHRDLKSANVMLADAGDRAKETAKIVDFGLVRAVFDVDRLTQAGQVLGTPQFMDPVVIGGGESTPSTDLYALGVIGFQMLTGEVPFAGQNPIEIMRRQLSEPAPRPPPARGLERIIGQLLEKEIAARPPSAEAVVAAIDALGLGPWQTGSIDLPRSGAATEWNGHLIAMPSLAAPPVQSAPARAASIPGAAAKQAGLRAPAARPPLWALAAVALLAFLACAVLVRFIRQSLEPPVLIEAAVPAQDQAPRAMTVRAVALRASPALASGAAPPGVEPAGAAGPETREAARRPSTAAPVEPDPTAARARGEGRARPAAAFPGGGRGDAVTGEGAADQQAIAELRAEFRVKLREVGLEEGDLERVPEAAAVAARFFEAVRASNLTESRTALGELRSVLARLSIPPDLLRRKLGIIGEMLESASSSLPRAELERFQDEYLELETAVRPNLGDAASIGLARRIRTLDEKLRARVETR